MKSVRSVQIYAIVALGMLLSGCASPKSEFVATVPMLILNSVECIRTTLGGGEDQVYLKLADGTRYPTKGTQTMVAGQTWNPGISIALTSGGSIGLFESDTVTSDDEIGTFNYNRSQPGTYTETMTGDSSIYKLTFIITQGGAGVAAPTVINNITVKTN